MSRSLRLVVPIALVAVFGGSIGTDRADAGPSGGAQSPALIERYQIAGEHGIPADARMVAANVTAVNPAANGFITVWPCDEERPETSNVNFLTGQVVPNLVLSRLSAEGTVCVFTLAVTDVIIDLVGFVPDGSALSALPTPVRVVDTRDEGSPVEARTSLVVPVESVEGVGADADVVMFNATAIAGTDPGFLSVYPCGESVPETSSVNYLPGQIVPNFVTARVGADGSVCIFTLADAHVIVDLAAHARGGVEPLEHPVRIVDTRESGGPQAAGATLRLDVAGNGDIPDDASAAVYNLTSVNSTDPGFATSYPCDVVRPDVSNLNFGPGQVVANGAITKLSAVGELCIYTLSPTDLIVDLIGHTSGTADYVAIDPIRIDDSREGWQSSCDWVLIDHDDRTATLANVATAETVVIDFGSSASDAPDPVVSEQCDGALRLAGSELRFVTIDGTVTTSPTDPSVESLDVREIHLLDGRVVATNGAATTVDVLDGSVIWDGIEGASDVRHIAFSSTELALVTIGFETAQLWHIADDVQLPLPFDDVRPPYDFSPDGRSLAATDSSVYVITTNGSFVDEIVADIGFHSVLGFVGDGRLALCNAWQGLVTWDLFSGTVRQVGPPREVDGQRLDNACAVG